MTTLTDEQYQQYLEIRDETYGGLTWDQGNGHYIVTGSSAYAGEYEETGDTSRVWKDDGGQIVVNGDILTEDMDHYCREAGLDDERQGEAQERLNLLNR